ncbi:MAG: hypothetical protein Q4E88_01635 [Coriobacteriia bacterium]|nr:hypothetical protein [Coriobacteriia bacterium]
MLKENKSISKIWLSIFVFAITMCVVIACVFNAQAEESKDTSGTTPAESEQPVVDPTQEKSKAEEKSAKKEVVVPEKKATTADVETSNANNNTKSKTQGQYGFDFETSVTVKRDGKDVPTGIVLCSDKGEPKPEIHFGVQDNERGITLDVSSEQLDDLTICGTFNSALLQQERNFEISVVEGSSKLTLSDKINCNSLDCSDLKQLIINSEVHIGNLQFFGSYFAADNADDELIISGSSPRAKLISNSEVGYHEGGSISNSLLSSLSSLTIDGCDIEIESSSSFDGGPIFLNFGSTIINNANVKVIDVANYPGTELDAGALFTSQLSVNEHASLNLTSQNGYAIFINSQEESDIDTSGRDILCHKEFKKSIDELTTIGIIKSCHFKFGEDFEGLSVAVDDTPTFAKTVYIGNKPSPQPEPEPQPQPQPSGDSSSASDHVSESAATGDMLPYAIIGLACVAVVCAYALRKARN